MIKNLQVRKFGADKSKPNYLCICNHFIWTSHSRYGFLCIIVVTLWKMKASRLKNVCQHFCGAVLCRFIFEAFLTEGDCAREYIFIQMIYLSLHKQKHSFCRNFYFPSRNIFSVYMVMYSFSIIKRKWKIEDWLYI